MESMADTWKEHPLAQAGKVELVPTEWVVKYAGEVPDVFSRSIDGVGNMEELWENLLSEGLKEPLIMRVGLQNKKARLEAGNHRIQLFHAHGIKLVPVTVQIRDICAPHLDDSMTVGEHVVDVHDDVLLTGHAEEYLAPSKVFKSLNHPIDVI